MSVNKSNILIQKIKHNLTALEQKLLDKVVEQIDTKADKFQHFYYLDLNSFIKNDLNKDVKDYTNFTHLKDVLEGMVKKTFRFIEDYIEPLSKEKEDIVKTMVNDKKLSFEDISRYSGVPLTSVLYYAKSMKLSKTQKKQIKISESKIINPPKKDLFTNWFASVETYTRSNIVRVEISEAMKPYYSNLNGYYDSVNASDVYKLKSKYSIRIYELISSYKNIKNKKGTSHIEKNFIYIKLKELLGAENKYDRYNDFKRKVLETAKKELKEKDTDFQFDYEVSGIGKYKTIIFKIYNKKEEKIKENKIKKEELINNSDDLDKRIYTDIEEALKKGGVSPSVRNSLVTKFDEMQLRRNIDMQYKRLSDGKITRKELPGALVKSIKEDWAMGNYEQKQEYKKNKEKTQTKNVGKLLPIENIPSEIDKQKDQLKNNTDLYKEFIDFMKERAKNKPDGRASSMLPDIILDINMIDTTPFIDKFIDKFFKIMV